MLVGASPEFRAIADVVSAHHERWDGQGYPAQSHGENIPLAGRILTVLDVFEALTSNRPYRAPMEPAEALALIQSDSGTRFDPQIVQTFVSLYENQKLALSILDDTKLEHLHDRYGSGNLLVSRLNLKAR
jgi:HD-GYP domain-containing protein (c-di-GMP phosphodiesterase class II)